MELRDLPALNATLNATAFVLLLIGYRLIRQGKREAHKKVMLAAFTQYGIQPGPLLFDREPKLVWALIASESEMRVPSSNRYPSSTLNPGVNSVRPRSAVDRAGTPLPTYWPGSPVMLPVESTSPR